MQNVAQMCDTLELLVVSPEIARPRHCHFREAQLVGQLRIHQSTSDARNVRHSLDQVSRRGVCVPFGCGFVAFGHRSGGRRCHGPRPARCTPPGWLMAVPGVNGRNATNNTPGNQLTICFDVMTGVKP